MAKTAAVAEVSAAPKARKIIGHMATRMSAPPIVADSVDRIRDEAKALDKRLKAVDAPKTRSGKALVAMRAQSELLSRAAQLKQQIKDLEADLVPILADLSALLDEADAPEIRSESAGYAYAVDCVTGNVQVRAASTRKVLRPITQ